MLAPSPTFLTSKGCQKFLSSLHPCGFSVIDNVPDLTHMLDGDAFNKVPDKLMFSAFDNISKVKLTCQMLATPIHIFDE